MAENNATTTRQLALPFFQEGVILIVIALGFGYFLLLDSLEWWRVLLVAIVVGVGLVEIVVALGVWRAWGWAYAPAKLLARINRFSRFINLSEKLESPEVQEIFFPIKKKKKK